MKRLIATFALSLLVGCGSAPSGEDEDADDTAQSEEGVTSINFPGTEDVNPPSTKHSVRLGEKQSCQTCGPVPDPWEQLGPVPDPWYDPSDDK